ncbi:nSTAND1 domain-containing NTPase [Coleofasciculus sp. G2-EDA-02]|uniref:nSTAND1 domain-containing NTPase n=1 Tax=Coleofasciculus sp. G2-EDA-02 TaxID=3069529 RepID=UPI003302CAB7
MALEITASGRGRDVERLIGRIARDDCKLTVIHGQSGVGKSSIVNGGLVPALRQKMVKALDVLPIPLRVYTNWVEELGRLLVEGETSLPTPFYPPLPPFERGVEEGRKEEGRNEQDRNEQDRNEQVINPLNTPPFPAREGGLGGLGSTTAILAELRQNEQRHRLVVLIFDQFEEFFFVCQDTAARKPFFEFLSDCLNLPDVKVILSLREDYLHYLLECERLARIDVINNDILNKSNRYELGDFAPEDAQAIIEQLTARSQFHLESELVEQLVQDLAGDTGKVRPIELQIVGAQLQAEGITTLTEYRQGGTKDYLATHPQARERLPVCRE